MLPKLGLKNYERTDIKEKVKGKAGEYYLIGYIRGCVGSFRCGITTPGKCIRDIEHALDDFDEVKRREQDEQASPKDEARA
jgi:hypothetical protein